MATQRPEYRMVSLRTSFIKCRHGVEVEARVEWAERNDDNFLRTLRDVLVERDRRRAGRECTMAVGGEDVGDSRR